jgi:hypothetical protein
VPDGEGDAAVTDRHASDERLRAAFQSLGDTAREQPSAEDLEKVWRAASGDLPADERRELVDRMSTDPSLAESWRVAHELQHGASHGVRLQPDSAARHAQEPREARWWIKPWVAAAALVILAIGVGIVVQRSRPAGDDTLRDAGRTQIESLVPYDTSLPREAFRLRWTPGPAGSRYDVRVTTEDLQLLTTATDLMQPELVVNVDALATLASRTRVFWQVDVKGPGGGTISSPTFVVRVQ